jgi:hypothetical protein
MWNKVKKLKPISYTVRDWTPPADEERVRKEGIRPTIIADDDERWGFFAHELQESLVQSAATGTKDSKTHVQGPNQIAIIAAITKALQETMERVEQLEERIK